MDHGFSEHEARRFLARELQRQSASTSFYWENEEVEEVLDLIVAAVAKLIEANNKKVAQDMSRSLRGIH